MMSFHDLLDEYRQRFVTSGSFVLRKHDNLGDVLIRNRVPSEWGVYLIKCEGVEECLWIGKAGGPGIKRPGIYERLLKGKYSSGISLRSWFQDLMGQYHVNELKFEWFVTIDAQSKRYDPKVIRDVLWEAHKGTFGTLPLENGTH